MEHKISKIQKCNDAKGNAIMRITTDDNTSIFCWTQDLPKMEGIREGDKVNVDYYTKSSEKGDYHILKSIEIIADTIPVNSSQSGNVKSEEKDLADPITMRTVIQSIVSKGSFWEITDKGMFGTVYCSDKNLMSFEAGDNVELTCVLSDKGNFVLQSVQKCPSLETAKSGREETIPSVPDNTVKQAEAVNAVKADVPKANSEVAKRRGQTDTASKQTEGKYAAKQNSNECTHHTQYSPDDSDSSHANLVLYNKVRTVPKTAQKPFNNGRFTGTDINPMWRIKCLTELFGIAGIGWYTKITDKWLETCSNGEIKAFVNIELYVKVEGQWSMPIIGTGGNTFAASTKNGMQFSDEAFKMAYTDAMSVACKALGIGADVYWQDGESKYNN